MIIKSPDPHGGKVVLIYDPDAQDISKTDELEGTVLLSAQPEPIKCSRKQKMEATAIGLRQNFSKGIKIYA